MTPVELIIPPGGWVDGGFGDVREKTWAAATASANVLNSPVGVTCVMCQLVCSL